MAASEIKLRPAEARAHAQDVRDTQATALEAISMMRNRLGAIEDSFGGAAKDVFVLKLDEVKTGLDGLLAGLDGLGSFLAGCADAIEGLDVDLAAQLA